jgi:hypothetical protein
MRQIATVKATQIAARYGEHAPVATACCNACRSCVTTNVVALATAALVGAAAGIGRFARRFRS